SPQTADATAHSSAAEEDSPAPTGTSESSTRSAPGISTPPRRSDHTTPATYAAQPVTSPGAVSVPNSIEPSRIEVHTRTRASARTRALQVVRRSIAIGRHGPPL